ncbi:extracellular solute-binding protein [Kitasatospora sp. NPDC052896]|uniref:extracellular solute-binding protein n=1 Tax=Kitasatospora sp. NPDC052896 TaxID=3364061 RepID=UPI0037C742DC
MKSRSCAVLAASTLLLSGCGALGLGSNGDVTLKLVAADYGDHPATSTQHYWDDLVQRFERANPKTKVTVQVYPWTEIDQKVSAMIRAGDSPDLVESVGFADKVAAHQLYPARDVLTLDTEADFPNSFAQAGQVLGTQYGIPFVSSSRTFFYNKTIFKQAGIGQPPTTWDDLRADAALIRARVPGVTPYGLPLGPEEAPAETMMWTMSGGGGLADSADTYTIDSRRNVATFSWLRDNLVTPGYTYAHPGAVNRQNAFDDFAAGRVAMLNGHPSLIKQVQGKVDYGTAPIPREDASAKPTTLGVADWMMALSANGHRAQIRPFLSFVYSKENVLEFDEEYNLLPVTQDALDDMTAGGRHPDLKPFLDALPTANFYPVGDLAWDAVSARIKQDIGKAVEGDPGPVLGQLQDFAVERSKQDRPQ